MHQTKTQICDFIAMVTGFENCEIVRENELNMENTEEHQGSLRMEVKIYRRANECC
jgi:hypothetical protein